MEQDTGALQPSNKARDSRVISSQEDLQLTQKGLTAKSRRELRAKRKKAAADAEQRELDLAVAKLFRVADSVTDHRAISRDGWGVDHGYTGISFSSPSKKPDLSITQDKGSFESSFAKNAPTKLFHRNFEDVESDTTNDQDKSSARDSTAENLGSKALRTCGNSFASGTKFPLHVLRKEKLENAEKTLLKQIRVAYKKLKAVREGGIEEEEVGNDRAIIVSYNLPFSLTRDISNMYWSATPNEMANFGINTLERTNFQWAYVGWPGIEIDPSEQTSFRNQLLQENDYSPLFLKKSTEKLCRDFCYRIMHPVLHSTSLTTDFHMEIHDSGGDGNKYLLEEKMWTAYTTVMQQFADVIKDMYEEGDVVWLHGYQLMHLPKLIRQILPNCTIGYSLLAPFPTSELFRVLPRREELLYGLLSCDLLGFQSHVHARHFSSTCMRILGVASTTTKVNYFGQTVNINILPLGVDVKATAVIQRRMSTRSRVMELKKMFDGIFVFLGVGMPDLDGGILHGLFGYEEFLKQYSSIHKKRVIFVQIAFVHNNLDGHTAGSWLRRDPQIEGSISRVVGRINSSFSVMGSRVPVYYLQHDPVTMGMEEIYALYEIADCILSTPLRGGLTLVPSQYMLCRHGRKLTGTVVVSEFAASAESLSGALRVNPFDTEGISKALNFALNMSYEDRIKRSNQMIGFVKLYTAHRYLKKFSGELFKLASRRKAPNYMRKLDLSDLVHFHTNQRNSENDTSSNLPSGSPEIQVLPGVSFQPPKTIVDEVLATTNDVSDVVILDQGQLSRQKRLPSSTLSDNMKVVILDYEGVLVEPKSLAELEIVQPDVLEALHTLGKDKNTELFVFSNRKVEWMETSLKGINCSIAAEGGFYVKWAIDTASKGNSNFDGAGDETLGGWERQAPRDSKSGWIEHFRPIFEYFTKRTPGSFITETENTLAWQYQDADLEHAERNSLSLRSALLEIIVGWRVRLVKRSHCVELRLFGVFKKSIITEFCSRVNHQNPYVRPALWCALSGENKGDSGVFRYLKTEFPELWKADKSSPVNASNLMQKYSTENSVVTNQALPNIRCTVDLNQSEANYYAENAGDLQSLLVSCTV